MPKMKCQRCGKEYDEEGFRALKVRVSGGLTMAICGGSCGGTDFRPVAEEAYISAPGEPGLPRCSKCWRLLTSMVVGCLVHGTEGIDPASRRLRELSH